MQIPYGRTQLTYKQRFKPGEVLSPKATASVPPLAATLDAIRNPVDGSLPLAARVKPSDSAVVVVSDITRGWIPTAAITKVILAELLSVGLRRENITILVATGSHRAASRDEMIALLGQQILDEIKVVNHDCTNALSLVSLGKTRLGNPVSLNRCYVEADCRILTGGIIYHFMAGFGGGRKSLIPGIASYEAIQANHRMLLVPENQTLFGSGKTEGNPLHEDMMEAARKAPPTFLVNAIPGSGREVSGIIAGDWDTAWKLGTRMVEQNFGIPLEKPGDIVIASPGGFPMDLNLYQSSKALINAASAVKDGGGIVLVTQCSEGTGAPEFADWLNIPTIEDMAAQLAKGFTVPGFIAYMIRVIAKTHPTAIVTDLPRDLVRLTGMRPFDDIDLALDWLADEVGISDEGIVHILPAGNITLPVLTEM